MMLERPDLIVPFLIFSIVGFYTPGPNNIMLLTSGLTFGFKRTWPAMFGVAIGFSFLYLCMGLGLGAIFIRYPLVNAVVKYVGAAYILYLAWIIANAKPPDPDAVHYKKPMTFFQICALQWVNPKGLANSVAMVSTYGAIAAYPYNILGMSALFVILGLSSSIIWAGMGTALQKFLHRPKLVRAFNIVMAMLLAASLYPVFADAWK